MRNLLLILLVLVLTPRAEASSRVKAVKEAAEAVFREFGAKAGKNVPAVASRIESLAARYGDDAVLAVQKVGPRAFAMASGPHAAHAVRILARHGEQGAVRILSRPTAMNHVLKYGDDAAEALVKHPGVAEPLISKTGQQAVTALSKVTQQNGRRLAMLEGNLAKPEVMAVVAKHGDRAVDFLWANRATLAGGAALTAFLVNPEPFLNGARDLAEVATDGVVKPFVNGVTSVVSLVIGVVGLLLVCLTVLASQGRFPSLAQCQSGGALLKKRWAKPAGESEHGDAVEQVHSRQG